MRRHFFLLALFLSVCILILSSNHVSDAIPMGLNVSVIEVDNGTVRPAEAHTASGGSFTTMLLNVTSQTSKWKAYVGNVSGKITLDNSNSRTIYDWLLTTVQGEVYVSRNHSVNFAALTCANTANITQEENALNISTGSDDSINSTFRQKIHKSFVIGNTGIVANDTCFSIATYVNDATQVVNDASLFQEILMSDGRSLVYVSLLENKQQGYDQASKDFQLIVPDNPTEVSNAYYFYAELG